MSKETHFYNNEQVGDSYFFIESGSRVYVAKTLNDLVLFWSYKAPKENDYTPIVSITKVVGETYTVLEAE